VDTVVILPWCNCSSSSSSSYFQLPEEQGAALAPEGEQGAGRAATAGAEE
jgi:hypothetical protein